MTTKVSTFPLRLPVSLKTALEKISERAGTSVNHWWSPLQRKLRPCRQRNSFWSVAIVPIARRFCAF